jgi:hypothetical protein
VAVEAAADLATDGGYEPTQPAQAL